MSVAQFHRLTVNRVSPETEQAVCVSFAVPAELKDVFQFAQGQYLTLRREINGEDVRRSYSICSGTTDDELSIGVKRLEGGCFSNWLNDELQAGMEVEVAPPAGTFTSALDAQAERNYLCIAAGSGITPVLSIIKSVLASESKSTVTLLYGNQRVSSIMFRDELDRLKNKYMARFQLIHVLSQERRDTDILNGRIDNTKGAQLCQHLFDLNTVDHFFLCGPEAMVSEVSRGLRSFGIDESKIHYELFGASAEDAAAAIERHHERARRFGGQDFAVRVKADGRETELRLSPDGENILDAALDAGVDLPFACKGGACATCKAKLVQGEVEMDVCHALEADEIEAGYVLTCQAHPLSDDVVIDFDAAV